MAKSPAVEPNRMQNHRNDPRGLLRARGRPTSEYRESSPYSAGIGRAAFYSGLQNEPKFQTRHAHDRRLVRYEDFALRLIDGSYTLYDAAHLHRSQPQEYRRQRSSRRETVIPA